MSLIKYLHAHYTKNTAKSYQREIAIYLSNFKEADKAVYQDITHYLGLLRGRYSKAATLNRILRSIKVYYNYLCHEGIRTDNPAKAIELKDKPSRDIQLQDLFTAEELEALLNRKERFNKLDYRNKVLIGLIIYQALHPGEMEALQVADINLEAGTINIKPTPKANGRQLQLRSNQILLFHQYIHEIRPKLLKGKTSDALLIGTQGRGMKADDIAKHVIRSFRQLYPGRKVNAQTIRQSVIANLLKQGHDLSLVQGFAGHKYPSSTERYKQNEVETLRSAVNKYHPLQ